MRQENLSIYELIWVIRGIAKKMDCEPNGCILGDLMIDAIAFYKMQDGETRLWHIFKSGTWCTDDEDQFQENLYRVSKDNGVYTIEKIK